jgi:sodium transport system permease protein
MRRSIIWLIAIRELKDLLRDRRTMLVILGLPVVLYPLFVLVGVFFAFSMLEQTLKIGITNIDVLPTTLIENGQFLEELTKSEVDFSTPQIVPMSDSVDEALRKRLVDVVILVPDDFVSKLEAKQRPEIKIRGREADETSKLARKRLNRILEKWAEVLRKERFASQGIANDFHQPIKITDEQEDKPLTAKTADELRDSLVKSLPMLLVLWLLAGALHPAIDVTAGEKERGTMETLLISPADRKEIVLGKFLTIMIFSYGTAMWNVFWMLIGTLVLSFFLPFMIISPTGLLLASLLGLPLAAIFAGMGLVLGVFAKSNKEGQYYVMPMFLLTLPLVMWSLMPGVKLNVWMGAVPITGVALLQQHLMAIDPEPISWTVWLAAAISLVITVSISLWLAILQFRRESVLFRDSDPLKLTVMIKGWWKDRRGSSKI